jgi:hypothetical protein
LLKVGQRQRPGTALVRVLALGWADGRFDHLGQSSVRVHIVAAHHHVKSGLPPDHGTGEIDLHTAQHGP